MSAPAKVTLEDLGTLTRAEAEKLAAGVLRAVAEREPARSASQLVYLAVLLDNFAGGEV